VSLGRGHYQIQSVLSGKCLDVAGSRTTWGAAIVQNTCSSAAGQNWIIARQPNTSQNTWWRFESDESSQAMCVNVGGASQADGAALIQWPCVGASNETFRLDQFIDIR
jgi:hypothetical protein